MWTFAVAVLGGIITQAVLWGGKKAVPWIRQRYFSSEPTIAGMWTTFFLIDNKVYSEEVLLRQIGRKVWGQITLNRGNVGAFRYQFEGTFKQSILMATYHSIDHCDIEQGAFVLRYTRQATLEGHCILMAEETEDLVSREYKWANSNSFAQPLLTAGSSALHPQMNSA